MTEKHGRDDMLKFSIRLIAGLALIAAPTLASAPAPAQTAKTLRVIVPYTPGSGPDILSRLMADEIGRKHGTTVLVENRPGGGTLVGTEQVARAAPDGTTVLLVGNSFTVNPALKRPGPDITTAFDPVCYLASTPLVLVVKADSPYRTLDDLLAAARKEPGKLSLGSGGPASALHVAFEVVRRAAKVDMTYVPYGGTAPAITALMGGHITSVFADYPTVVAQLKGGTLRGLVTTSAKRVPPLPDVPTLSETRLSSYVADIYYGVVAPAKTPPDALKQLSEWFAAALEAPETTQKVAAQGMFPVGQCGAPFGDFLKSSLADYSRIIAEAGLKAE
jgi:tripartite-type tricarboxylate transporter receptor subunit TctC